MLPLRITASLSLLALVIGVAGTAWLSDQTDKWQGPQGRPVVAHASRPHAELRHAERKAHAAAVRHTAMASVASPARAATVESPTLTPIDMPPLSTSWFARAATGVGRVVLHLAVGGDGHVQQASVAQSSGDAALDDRAVRTVLRWRFAVPADHPDGVSGSLVMRFEDAAAPVAQTP